MTSSSRIAWVLAVSLIGALSVGGCNNQSSGPGGACVAQERTVAPIDPSSNRLAFRGAYVYVSSTGSSDDRTPSFSRIPIAGGPAEVIDSQSTSLFAANDSDSVVWKKDATTLSWLGPHHESRTLQLPADISGVLNLAMDRANNVFVLVNDAKGGNTVWRYSADAQTFDMLHHNLAGLNGFIADGDGVAWLGPAKGGVALYSESVTGGAPSLSAPLASFTGIQGGTYSGIIAVDANSIYTLTGGSHIEATDRTTGATSVTVDLAGASDTSTPPDPSSVIADDSSFFWVARDRTDGTTTIRRIAKSGGGIETVAEVNDIDTLAVGGCSLVYTAAQDSGSWGIVARPK